MSKEIKQCPICRQIMSEEKDHDGNWWTCCICKLKIRRFALVQAPKEKEFNGLGLAQLTKAHRFHNLEGEKQTPSTCNMTDENKNYGLIAAPPYARDKLFGALNGLADQVDLATSDWDPYLVMTESQSSLYFDTWNCVAESATNVIEIKFKYLIENNLLCSADINWLIEKGYLKNGEINFSARFVGTLAGTKVGVGNTGSNVAWIIYYYGLIPEDAWPFDLRERNPAINNPDNYYTWPPQNLLNLAKEFKERFKITYESSPLINIDVLLRKSPIQVYVNAWYKNADGLYYNPSSTWNHAVVRKRIDIKQIFDTYDPYEKGLTNDYYYYSSGYVFYINPQGKKEPMELKINQTYLLVEGTEQKIALATNNGLMIAPAGQEIFVLLNSAARLGGLDKVKVIPVSLSDWDSVPHFNLKGERIA